jgi:hypothetical protein
VPEFLPILVYPELHNLYLLIAIAIGGLIAVVILFHKFHSTFSRKINNIIWELHSLGAKQMSIVKRMGLIARQTKLIQADIQRVKEIGKVIPDDALFRFILLRYLASEIGISMEDKLLLAAMFLGTDTKLAKLLEKRIKEKKISDEEIKKAVGKMMEAVIKKIRTAKRRIDKEV